MFFFVLTRTITPNQYCIYLMQYILFTFLRRNAECKTTYMKIHSSSTKSYFLDKHSEPL